MLPKISLMIRFESLSTKTIQKMRMLSWSVHGKLSSKTTKNWSVWIYTNQLKCSIWHPLRGPLVDWPLGICDASTVDFASDTMPSDLVDMTGSIENMQVHHNESQQWYYLSHQMPSELLVFRNADSRVTDGIFPPGKCHSRSSDEFVDHSRSTTLVV